MKAISSLALMVVMLVGSYGIPAYGGGGGENMLLIVNPKDEPSLRIANAYIKARNIPTNNVLYLTPPQTQGFSKMWITGTQFTTYYQKPILDAIATRGLSKQIDYLGTIGQSQLICGAGYATGSFPWALSVNNCLVQLTQFSNGMTFAQFPDRISEIYQNPELFSYKFNYTPGSNPAIHHSQLLTPTGVTGTASHAQLYMSGMIGYSGQLGQTTTQVIQNLQRTAAADGTKPVGTIYFEDGTDIRVTTRKSYWPAVQAYMTAHNIPWIQENQLELNSYNSPSGYGAAPANRSNVRGAALGTGAVWTNTQAVNGSAYTPGAWADNLTSYGGVYTTFAQNSAAASLLGGCGGTAGSITEPYANQNRFTMASVWVYQNDGSTLGEAFFKSVRTPDIVMFQGDLLSQAYADVPVVTFVSGPANGTTVSGTVSIGASASLDNPQTATGIASLALYVDGKDTALSVSGSSGLFSLNTTTLTDGLHEVRVVAYNNSQAASEGYVLENLVVNNTGQSVSIGGSSAYNISWNQSLSIPVTAVRGSGPAITGIQLQSFGRTVGAISGASGNVMLSGTSLAYGSNTITPVAILSSSNQVIGQPITVTRQFQQLAGKTPTSAANQIPGFDFYFYGGAAGKTLATTSFSGSATYILHSNSLNISPNGNGTAPINMPKVYRSGSNARLAVQIKGAFTVPKGKAGEYSFSFFTIGNYNTAANLWSSFNLSIDGITVSSYDAWNGTSFALVDAPNCGGLDSRRSVYLLPGEHSLNVKLAQYPGATDANSQFALWVRGPDGNTYPANGPTFYTINKNIGR